jgi:ribosomal protein L17
MRDGYVDKMYVFAGIAEQLVANGQLEQAVALSMENAYTKDWALRAIVDQLIASGQIAQAQTVALSIKGERKAEALEQIVAYLAKQYQYRTALATLGIQDIENYMKFLSEWRESLAKGYPDKPQ